MEKTAWPNDNYPPPSPYARFRQQQGLEQRQERSPLPLAQTVPLRLPNVNDWSKEQEAEWMKKDSVEIERYYLNTHLNIKKMKKSPRGKPTCLIRKKKEWRNGLANILVNTVDGWKPMHKSPLTTPIAQASVPTVHGMPYVKKGMTSGIGMRGPTPIVPSFKITSSTDEETEEEDTLLLNND